MSDAKAASSLRSYHRNSERINARRRELRKITYEPRQCQEPECTNIYQPMRSDSMYCSEQACINRRQNENRAKRKGNPQ